jgi:hypothetical protein
MKSWTQPINLLCAATLTLAAGAASAADVGVSVEVSQPGVYGRIDIGRFPQPQLIVPQPVVIARPAVVVAQPQPVYMWVPQGHRKDWSKHCRHYNACGAPVYFVRHDWYNQHVMVAADSHGGPGHGGPGHGQGKGGGKGKGHGKGHD